MKPSDNISSRIAGILVWGLPVIMLIPNIALGVRGNMSALASFANVLLPAGILLLFMTWRSRPGTNALLLLPFMVLAAFQIVLLFLYADGSIIGVDMFLNVTTSNTSEAKELLDNLRPAIITVVALYLPAIVLAVVSMRLRVRASAAVRNRARLGSAALSVSGGLVLAICVITDPLYHVDEDLYPVNVLVNLGSAFKRSYDAKHYAETSAGCRYEAESIRPDSLREVYVAVIGETSRADNWQLFGYNRFTTPRLCSLPGESLATYGRTLSESNTTHKSVPLLLSVLSASGFADSLNRTTSVISIFKEAGFKTAYISAQRRNGSYIEYFAAEADTVIYLRDSQPGVVNNGVYDRDMLAPLDTLLAAEATKLFVVMHQYGSHFNYADRYPREQAFFIPDKTANASAENRGQLINAYDNSIRQTDEFLYSVICRLDSIGCYGGMVYASDHGEDIFDDARGRFLHASPAPTYFQLHVPMVVYMTPALRRNHSGLIRNAKAHQGALVSSSGSYTPTLLHLAGISSKALDTSKALTSPDYVGVDEPLFLSDRNRAVTLLEAGFQVEDYARLQHL